MIEVLVERIAAVGGDHDRVGARARDHGGLARESASFGVSRRHVPAEKARDLTAPVLRQVDAEIDRQERPAGADLALRGVSLQHPPGAARVADDLGAVVVHDRIDVGQRREDPLVAAGEPGHEVGLDEAEHDAPVGLYVLAVEVDGPPVFALARGRERLRVVRRVVDDAVARHNLAPDHRGQLRDGIGAVRAGAVDDREVAWRNVLELGEEPREKSFRRKRARDVGDHDGDPLGGANQLAERARSERRADRVAERRRLVGQSRQEGRGEHRHVLGRDLRLQAVVAVVEPNSHAVVIPRRTARFRSRRRQCAPPKEETGDSPQLQDAREPRLGGQKTPTRLSRHPIPGTFIHDRRNMLTTHLFLSN